MKFNAKKLVSFILAVAIIAAAFLAVPSKVEAATRKVSTTVTSKMLNSPNGGLSAAGVKKTPTVKVGVNKVTQKNASTGCYTKFVAPSSGTYVFKFSNPSTPKGASVNGHITMYTKNGKYLDWKKGKVYGGSAYTFRIANSKFLKYWTNSGADKTQYYFTSRSYTTTLKKGETLFIYGYFAGGVKEVKMYNVKITKK